jgi:hypothetical protein
VDWASIDLTVLDNLPARLDDRQLAAIDHIARLPVPVLPPAEEDYFLKCMRTLRLLPGRTDDDISGGLRLNLYRRHFGNLSRDALAYLTDRATATCKWFPTPAELFEILKGWERTDPAFRAIRRARILAQREWQERFDDVMRRFKVGEVEQDEVDAMPERWKEIAATQGWLWREDFKLRPVHRPADPPEEQTDAPD